jgi:hypothetical protein
MENRFNHPKRNPELQDKMNALFKAAEELRNFINESGATSKEETEPENYCGFYLAVMNVKMNVNLEDSVITQTVCMSRKDMRLLMQDMDNHFN